MTDGYIHAVIHSPTEKYLLNSYYVTDSALDVSYSNKIDNVLLSYKFQQALHSTDRKEKTKPDQKTFHAVINAMKKNKE